MEVKKLLINLGEYLSISQKANGINTVRYKVEEILLSGEEDLLLTLQNGELTMTTQNGWPKKIRYQHGSESFEGYLGDSLVLPCDDPEKLGIIAHQIIRASFNGALVTEKELEDVLFSAGYNSSGKLVSLTLEER